MVCFGVCEAPWNDWVNGGSVSVDDFTRMVSMVFVLMGVGPALGNRYGI